MDAVAGARLADKGRLVHPLGMVGSRVVPEDELPRLRIALIAAVVNADGSPRVGEHVDGIVGVLLQAVKDPLYALGGVDVVVVYKEHGGFTLLCPGHHPRPPRNGKGKGEAMGAGAILSRVGR